MNRPSRERPLDPPSTAAFAAVVAGSTAALDAVERFLRRFPRGTGGALIVFLRQDGSAPASLAELLVAWSSNPVRQLVDGALLEPDSLYLADPGVGVGLCEGVVQLRPGTAAEHQLDDLLRALATDFGDVAAAVLLSGLEREAAAGLEAVRVAGGLTLIQHHGRSAGALSALADGEPKETASVAEAAEQSPEQLAERLVLAMQDRCAPIAPDETVDQLVRQLQLHTAFELTHYKRSTLLRRARRRMELRRIGELDGYAELLAREPEEAKQLAKDLLIGVTRFFRDREAFEVLRSRTLLQSSGPESEGPQSNEGPVRVWVAGCATGEEAYSLAMLLLEAQDASPSPRRGVVLYATDVDEAALTRARRGLYPTSIEDDVSPARLERFFHKVEGGYQVRREVRELVVFAVHDLTADPPFTRLDLLSCRNVLIYYTAKAQQRIIALFHFALLPKGTLLLGASEALGIWEHGFEPIDAGARVFRRRELSGRVGSAFARSLGIASLAPKDARFAVELSALAQPFDALPAGIGSVRDLVRVTLDELGVPTPGRAAAEPALPVDPGSEPARLRAENALLVAKLASVRQAAQVQTEELQSANEELQSANEELLTAREEAQSANEELLVLNAELRASNEALEVTNNDMRNLLNSSQIPTLFLDSDLRLMRFTQQARRIANLLPSDVGRPLTDIVLQVRYDQLAHDVATVLDTLVFKETRVEAKDGSVFTVRIHPYRTAQNLIDGVVITFSDVTALLEEANSAHAAGRREVAIGLVAQWPGVGYVLQPSSGQCVAVSAATSQLLGYPDTLLAHSSLEFWSSLRHPEDQPIDAAAQARRCRLKRADGSYRAFDEVEVRLDSTPRASLVVVLLTALSED